MIRETVSALLACLVTFVLCAIAYPAVVWGLSLLVFPHQAEGSLIYDRHRNLIGSELVGQPFSSARYFHPRPSAVDYKADATGGSNLGSKNPDLHKKIAERAEELKATADQPAPVDLVMASGSGLDPHISPEAADYQLRRVAAARGLPEERIRTLIEANTERSGAIIGGPPRVNVLRLNLALDEERPATSRTEAAEAAKKTGVAEPTRSDSTRHALKAQAAPTVASGPADTVPSMAEEVGALRSRIGELASRIDRLGKQLEPTSGGATEHAHVRARLDAMGGHLLKLVDDNRRLPLVLERVAGLDARLRGVDGSVRQLQFELREARHSLEALAKPAAPAPARATSRTTGANMVWGIESFKKGRYAAAAVSFRTAIREDPDDARAWYFAALANGLATKQWQGETEELVKKGVEFEKAGKPPAVEIDAAFSDLVEANGRDWLNYYRRRVAQ